MCVNKWSGGLEKAVELNVHSPTMSTEIQKFTSTICDNDITVAAVMVDGAPWFCAKDVATALGYANPQQAVRHNVDDADRAQLKDLRVLCGSTQPEHNEGAQAFISESGLYSLILASQKPAARAFQRWVTRDVLPSIRKTGQYTIQPEVTKKRVALEIVELDERIKGSKRRCIEEGTLSLQRLGLPVDDRDKMRAKDCLNEITFGQLQDAPSDNEVCIRSFLSERGIRNATMDSKLGRAAKQLYMKDHPDYTFQKKQIYANGQMLPANVWRESMRPYLERALEGILAS